MQRNISQQIIDRQRQGQQGLTQHAANVHIYRRLAEEGDARGLFNYGKCLLHGEGTAKNEQRGLELIKQAIEKGLVEAEMPYACALMNGRGCEVDKEKAIELIQKHAYNRDQYAQFLLGHSLEYGSGIHKNIDQAIYWYQESAKQGCPFAKARLHDIQRNQRDALNLNECHISQWIINENDYLSIDFLGKGGSGSVYKMQNKRTGEFYALKCFTGHPTSKSVIIREAKILIGLEHPCVLSLKGIVINENLKIMTKYCQNKSLADVLDKGKKVHWWNHTAISKIIIGIVAGMRYVHKRCIIHRDLKPDNILIDENLNSLISDFGLGCFDHIHKTFAGTIIYMAPEILNGCPYGSKIDVYSFGLILFEIIYGSQLFFEAFKHTDDIRRGWRPSLPRNGDARFVHNAIFDIISECWDINPNKRPTFVQIFRILEAIDFNIFSDVNVTELRAYADKIDPDEKIQLNW